MRVRQDSASPAQTTDENTDLWDRGKSPGKINGGEEYLFYDEADIPEWLLEGEKFERPNSGEALPNTIASKQQINTDRQVIQIQFTKEQEAAQAFNNRPAQAHFIDFETQGPSGQEYEYNEYVDGMFFVKINSKSLLDFDSTDNFEYRNVTLNRNALYLFKSEDKSAGRVKNYRGDVVSIQTSELYINGVDNKWQSKCCHNVKPISFNALYVGGDNEISDVNDQNGGASINASEGFQQKAEGFAAQRQAIVRCFRVNGGDNVWSICDQSIQKLQAFRSQLIIHTLYSVNKYVKHVLFLHEVYQWVNFSFSDQESWPGLCKFGKAQSPIDITKVTNANQLVTRNMRMKFAWRQTTVDAFWLNGEVELRGNFGSMQFDVDLDDNKPMEFFADRIRFKVTGVEHRIPDVERIERLQVARAEDDTQQVKTDDDQAEEDSTEEFVGEMLVFMHTVEGSNGIASFMLKHNPEDGQYKGPNKFLQNINLDEWVQKDGWSKREENQVDLDYLYKKYTQLYYKKDVFWYVGSDTTPPCQEGVYRFVFKNPVYVSASDRESLQLNAKSINEQYNHRTLQPVGLRTVFYADDHCAGCENYEKHGNARFEYTEEANNGSAGPQVPIKEEPDRQLGGDPRTWGPSTNQSKNSQDKRLRRLRKLRR